VPANQADESHSPKHTPWHMSRITTSAKKPLAANSGKRAAELTKERRRSNPHRYLFLLFREPDGLDLTEADVGGHEFPQRRSFDAPAFVEQHKLTLVAVNWMRGAGDGWAE